MNQNQNQIVKWLIEQEKQNIDLQTMLDVPAILRASENVDMDYLGNLELNDISTDIINAVKHAICRPPSDFTNEYIRTNFCEKLKEYRLVDQIYQLHKGKYVRWIRIPLDDVSKPKCIPKLTAGGVVMDIKFLDNGTYVLCKNHTKFIQYKFDDCLTFQKLSSDEQMILTCYTLIREMPKK